MSVYTITPDFLRNIKKDEGIYFTDILFVFTHRESTYRVSRDNRGEVLRTYESIDQNRELIKMWLDLMSFKPSRFEELEIDVSYIDCEETKFLKICRATIDSNKIIYYSKQNIKKFICEGGCIDFDGALIYVLDRDEAKSELNAKPQAGDTYIHSQVAKGSSSISNSKNN